MVGGCVTTYHGTHYIVEEDVVEFPCNNTACYACASLSYQDEVAAFAANEKVLSRVFDTTGVGTLPELFAWARDATDRMHNDIAATTAANGGGGDFAALAALEDRCAHLEGVVELKNHELGEARRDVNKFRREVDARRREADALRAEVGELRRSSAAANARAVAAEAAVAEADAAEATTAEKEGVLRGSRRRRQQQQQVEEDDDEDAERGLVDRSDPRLPAPGSFSKRGGGGGVGAAAWQKRRPASPPGAEPASLPNNRRYNNNVPDYLARFEDYRYAPTDDAPTDNGADTGTANANAMASSTTTLHAHHLASAASGRRRRGSSNNNAATARRTRSPSPRSTRGGGGGRAVPAVAPAGGIQADGYFAVHHAGRGGGGGGDGDDANNLGDEFDVMAVGYGGRTQYVGW